MAPKKRTRMSLEDGLISNVGALVAQFALLNDAVNEIKKDVSSMRDQVAELKTKIAVHAAIFGFVGSVVMVAASEIIKNWIK